MSDDYCLDEPDYDCTVNECECMGDAKSFSILLSSENGLSIYRCNQCAGYWAENYVTHK